MKLSSLTRVRRKYATDGLRDLVVEGIYKLAEGELGQSLLGERLLRDTSVISQSDLPDAAVGCWGVTDDSVAAVPIPPETRVSDNYQFSGLNTSLPTRPFICNVEDVTLLPPSGLGITGQKVLKDTIAPKFHSNTRIKQAVARSVLDVGYRTTRAVISSNSDLTLQRMKMVTPLIPMYRNYYHWTIECLTRLFGIEQFHQQTGMWPTLLLPSDPPSWIIESLHLLDIHDYSTINSTPIRADQLVVPSYPDPSATECRWLQQRMVAATDAEQSDQLLKPNTENGVYISRADATSRQVLNEKEVITAIEPLGIEPYVLGSLSVEEQVRLFRNADLIVSPHGAGLTNLIYGKDPTVIELFGHKRKTTYYRLAKLMGVDYHELLCESSDTDLIVDTEALRQTIAQVR